MSRRSTRIQMPDILTQGLASPAGNVLLPQLAYSEKSTITEAPRAFYN